MPPAPVAATRPEPSPFSEPATALAAAPPVAAAQAARPAPALEAAPRPRPALRPAPDPALASRSDDRSLDTPPRLRDRLAAKSAPTAPAGTAAARAPADERRTSITDASRASIAAQPERWSWQRGGAIQPMRPALQRWLAEPEAIDSARAQQRGELATADAPEAPPLRLYRDGMLVTTLRVTDPARRQALDDATR